MIRTARLAVLASALALAAPLPALAQDDPAATQDDASAERAFLNAYYMELGRAQHVRALADYRAVLEKYPDAPVVPRVWLGIARTLDALGRRDEALAALDHLAQAFPSDLESIAAAAKLRAAFAEPASDDLAGLVRAALAEDAWESRVPSFGGRAVPVLKEMLRAADPAVVYRAARSLLRIGTDDACDALLAALTADDVLYPTGIWNSALAFGPFPERLGRGILALGPGKVRDTLVANAAKAQSPAATQPWLGEAVLGEPWVREIVFPQEPVGRAGTASLVVHAICAGPGPARDAALAHLKLYSPKVSRRGRGVRPEPSLDYTGDFFQPPPALLADREALRVAAGHVYAEDGNTDPSEALRDALLADPETRDLALAWTWRYRMVCGDRDLFVNALAASDAPWPGPADAVLSVLRRSLDPRPSLDEWRSIFSGHTVSGSYVSLLLDAFADDGEVSPALLDSLFEAGAVREVLSWMAPKKLQDAAWAERALPPILRSSDVIAAVAAAELLAKYHFFGRVDATAHVADFVALFRNDGIWSTSMVLPVLLDRMGQTGVDAVIAATPTGSRGDDAILTYLMSHERPEASTVAERMLLGPIRADDRNAVDRLKRAVWVLAVQRGDDAVPVLLRAVRMEPAERRAVVADQTFRRPEISARGHEAFVSALIDDLPAGVQLQVQTGIGSDALRPLALRALATDHETLQVWGAAHEAQLLDPAAAARLGELAESSRPRVRSEARTALAAMRKADADMAWMRAVAARRATRGRVDAYLASSEPKERMAGIAGLVALRAADALERLLDIAAKDADAEVRAEARRALLALGDSRQDHPPEGE